MNGESHGLKLLTLVLFVAVAVRLCPIVFEIPVSRDAVEYQNIAQNLRSGRGFTLDIKVYYQVATPVVHYSGYDRAPLFPLALASAGVILPPDLAARLLPPFLYMFTLVLIFSLIARLYSASAAFWTTLLLALHPGLYRLSLMPLSEVTALFFVALVLWAHFRVNSPLLAGLAAAMAFLARPSSALPISILGIGYLWRAATERSFRPFVLFVAFSLLGPAALIAINIKSDAAALTTPQSFLFRVLHFTDGVHYFHQDKIYDSTAALLSDKGGTALRLVFKNAFYYMQSIAGISGAGIGYLIPLLPIALLGASGGARMGFVLTMMAMGAIDLAFHTSLWSSFDPDRFLMLFDLTAIVVIAAEGWQSLANLSERAGPYWRLLPPGVLLTIALLWGASDINTSYVAIRESRAGLNFSKYDDLWNTPDRRAMEADMKAKSSEFGTAIIATNEPWLAHSMTNGAAALLPYDLTREEWLPFIIEQRATCVLLHEKDWPETDRAHLAQLREVLKSRGWRLEARHGDLDFWSGPSPFKPPATSAENGVQP